MPHMTTICHVSAPKFEKSAANVFQKFIMFSCLLLFWCCGKKKETLATAYDL